MFFCSPINPPRKSCPNRLGSMFMKYHQVTLPGASTHQERSGRARGAHSDFPQWDAGGEQAAGFAQPVRIHLAWILGPWGGIRGMVGDWEATRYITVRYSITLALQLDPTGVSVLYYRDQSPLRNWDVPERSNDGDDTMQEELVATMGREFTYEQLSEYMGLPPQR